MSQICLGCMSFGTSNWYEWVLDEEESHEINDRVARLADEKGVSMAQIALAWVLHQDVVDAPIVGTTSVEHLEQAVEALEIDLR